ncbi:UvrB/UvrC motif-containing protein [Stenotrophomonas maltophilia]|uniref:UvrB/UvrC motif-containing protein n=1 Tax=Stenotrophomonas maltophilia TaxID=40324 RepID=UPI0021C65F93|nr:UvrB/UvrC motif-containing protein [Stenotrophomonas maltophilia]MCU1142518.1 UvrB/UvrC motif-containing protein [Stenotrophomonas maltophilia]
MSAPSRTGVVSFGDASLSVWEDPGMPLTFGNAWERQFKADVFARIVQQLNRMGWACEVPAEMIERYGINFARRDRYCRKGDLHAQLSVGGRHIELKFWQELHNVSNPNGGRYDFDKEQRMPYLLRLQMEHTRRKLRDYLVNVFDGYTFQTPKISSPSPCPLAYFNEHWDSEYDRRRGTHRFDRGVDGWPSENALRSWCRKDADGVALQHGDVRCIRDRQGRVRRGRVYGGINGMWMLVYGPGQRDHMHETAGSFFSYVPGMPRKVVSAYQANKRLQQELAQAISNQNFERAIVLRNVTAQRAEVGTHG